MTANGKFPLCIEGIHGRHIYTQCVDIYQSNALIYLIDYQKYHHGLSSPPLVVTLTRVTGLTGVEPCWPPVSTSLIAVTNSQPSVMLPNTVWTPSHQFGVLSPGIKKNWLPPVCGGVVLAIEILQGV